MHIGKSRGGIIAGIIFFSLIAVRSDAASCRLYGKIIDAGSRGIAGVEVRLYDNGTYKQKTSTDSTGMWEFTVNKSSNWKTTAHYPSNPDGTTIAEKYVDVVTTSQYPFRTLKIVIVQHKISGYAKDKQGKGVSGLQVSLYSTSQVLASTYTNASGYYEFVGKVTQSGVYSVSVNQSGKLVGVSAFSVNISSNSTKVDDIIINTDPTTYVINGTVRDASNSQAPLSGVTVQLYQGSNRVNNPETTDSYGKYTLRGVPAYQSYTLRFSKSGYVTKNEPDNSRITIDVYLTANRPLYGIQPISVVPKLDPSGENGAVDVSVQNFGQTDVGALSIGIHASLNQNQSIAGDPRIGSISVPGTGIPKGQDRTFSSNWLPLATLTPGQSYYIKANIDENRAYPADDASDNVRASADRITVQASPPDTELTLDRFKIKGQITQTSPNTYSVAGGGYINDFVYIPAGAVIHTDVHSVVLHNQNLILRPSPLTGGQSGMLEVLRGMPTMTLQSLTGTIHELGLTENMTFGLGTGCAFKINQLEIEPFEQVLENNELSGGFQAALPLSRRAMKDAVTPGIFGRIFEDRPQGWVYLDAEGGFRPRSFFGEFSISGDGICIFNNALKITSAGGGFDTQDRSIALSGEIEIRALGDFTLSLEELRLLDYYKPDVIHIVAEADIPVIPFPYVPRAYIFGFDKFGIEARSLLNRASDDLKFGAELGVMLGFLKVPVPYHGYASLKLLHLDVDGAYWPNKGDWEASGSARVFIWDGFPRFFNGHELARVRCHYYNAEKLFELEDAMLNCFNIYVAQMYLSVDTDDNTASGQAEGFIQVPPDVMFFGGLKLGEARAWTNTTPEGADIHGYARATFLPGGIGFRFEPNGEWDLGIDLYEKYAQKADGAKAPISVEVPYGQSFAIIRLSYASGNTDAVLTAPNAAQYDAANAAIVDGYSGPVFYRANDGVEEDGQPRQEICFFLNPAQGESQVLPGPYQLELTNPGGVTDAQVALWLLNEPPSIAITEPSVPVTVDPLAPQPVHIAFAGSDPAPAPEDDPDYDALQDVEIYLYYDTDKEGHDGQLINTISTPDYVGPDPLRVNQTSYEWDTAGVPTGAYYVYAMITDGRNAPVFSDYADGLVTITHPEAPASPTNFAAWAAAGSIECSWTASTTTTPAPTYVILYDDKPTGSPERYENSLETEGQTQWTIPNLTYGRDYRLAVVAMNPDTYVRSHPTESVTVPFYSTTANNAPRIISAPVTEGRVDYPYEYQVMAEDVDGDTLTFDLVPREVEGHPELVSPPPGVMIDPDTGLIAFTPVDGHLGANRIEVQVSDNKGGTDTQEFYVNIDNWMTPNSAPVFEVVPPQTVFVESAFEYAAHAEDADDDSLTYRFLEPHPAGMTIDPGRGIIQWNTTTGDAGQHIVMVEASDGKGGVSDPPLVLTINVEYPPLTLDPDEPFTFTPNDPQASPVKVRFTAQPETRFVTNYIWDFGDGTPVLSGLDKQTVEHVFYYDLPDGGDLEDRIFSVQLIIEGPGHPAADATRNVTVRPPKPIADFTAEPWTGESPLQTVLTATTRWATDLAWDIDNDGEFEHGNTKVVPHIFTAPFAQSFPVCLKAKGPSGETRISKKVIVQPSFGTLHTVFNHPAANEWPGWHLATQADLDEVESDGELSLSSNLIVSTKPAPSPGSTSVAVGPLIASGGAFEFTFVLVPAPTFITVDGRTNVAVSDILSKAVLVDLASTGNYEFVLTGSSFRCNGSASVDPHVCIRGDDSWGDNLVFTLNGEGDSKTITTTVSGTARLFFIDDIIGDNVGTSTVEVQRDGVAIGAFEVHSVDNCAYLDKSLSVYHSLMGSGRYGFMLLDSTFRDNLSIANYQKHVICIGGGVLSTFSLNGNGNSSVTDEIAPHEMWLFFVDPVNVDNDGSSTVHVDDDNAAGTAYVIFSHDNYLKIDCDLYRVSIFRVTPSGTEIIAEHLPVDLASSPSLSIRYDGIGTSTFMVNQEALYSWDGALPTAINQVGLGCRTLVEAQKSQQFGHAQLVKANMPPRIGLLGPVTLVSGEAINLTLHAEDDFTPLSELQFGVSQGSVVGARLQESTNGLLLVASLGVSEPLTETLQVTVTDEDGLTSTAELEVTVTVEGSELFTNIAGLAETTAPNGSGVALNDLPGDALLDLVAAREMDSLVLYANTGTLPMDARAAARGLSGVANMWAVAYGDVNNDGAPDAVFTGATESQLYLSVAPGHFSRQSLANLDDKVASGIALADTDKDGDLDIYFVRPDANVFLRNQLIPEGSLDLESVPSGLADSGNGQSAVFSDVDLDGDLDCYVVNRGEPNALYLNDGTGVFTLALGSGAEIPGDSYGAVFADFNNDGYPDLYVANDENDALLINDGDPEGDGWNGTFTDITLTSGILNDISSRSVCALDYDNDGWLDVFISNHGDPNTLYRNNGASGGGGWSSAFTDVSTESGVRGPANNAGMGAVVGDVDQDGDVDIFQVNANGQPAALFRNNLLLEAPGRHWLQVQLIGTASNTSAIGARIDLMKAGQIWQTREVSGGSGWRSQNSLVQHFGLGADTFAEEVVVYWPSGNVTRRHFEPAEQRLVITEEHELAAIQILPGRATIAPETTRAFTAEGIYANGHTALLDPYLLYWEIGDGSIAYVDGTGTVLGLTEGTTQLTAQMGAVRSYPAEIIVSNRELERITLAPATATLAVGERLQLIATAHYEGGTTEPVTQGVTWFSNDWAVASIGGTGLLRAREAGNVGIEAEFRGVMSEIPSGQTFSAEVEVVDEATALTLSPADRRLYLEPYGQAIPFMVERSIGAGPAGDVTNQVTWESKDPFVAWIDGRRLLLTAAPGDTELRAAYGGARSEWSSVQVRQHLSFAQDLPDEFRHYLGDAEDIAVEAAGGYEPVTYAWSKDGTAIGSNSPRVPLDLTTADDAGSLYSVTVSDGFTDSIASNTSTLRVAEHLQLLLGLPASTEGVIGKDHTFVVAVEGGFEPVSFQWYKESESKALIPVGENAPTLTLDHVSESDSGAYEVQIGDAHTDMTQSSTQFTAFQQVPLLGFGGLAALGALMTLGGIVISRKRR